MKREEALRIVAEARSKGERPDLSGADLSRESLSGADLRGVDLRGADLSWAILSEADLNGAILSEADLTGANLRGVDLNGADLNWANLIGADLRWARLSDADLRGAGLSGANLYAVPQILQVNNLPSGAPILVPTPDGWVLTIGCWKGALDDLRTLIAGDEWPEAEGAEQERRRPYLEALIAMCEAHTAYWPNVTDELKEKWGNE